MFKFNFDQDTESEKQEKTCDAPVLKSKELNPDTILSKIKSELNPEKVSSTMDMKILQAPLFEHDTLVDISHTDLKPNVYEGGYKVWECTFDLLDFLKNDVLVDKLSTLDIGCGAGLLGLHALLKGASHVSFQDYNQEVLESLTLPNVLLNTEDLSKCKFFHGDWSSLSSVVQTKFDIILTSETIYSVANYNKLMNVFKTFLKPSGCVYLAAKVYYFGVGGCVFDFEKLLEDNKFLTSTVWEQNEGVKRKIIKIQFKPAID